MTTTQENLQSSKLGTMPVGRLILTMSGPAILSMLVQALYNIVDSVFIGMYDATNGVLALSYAMPMQLLVNAFAIGLAVGAGSLISRLLGEGRNKDASLAAQTGLLISFIFSALFWCWDTLYPTLSSRRTPSTRERPQAAKTCKPCTKWVRHILRSACAVLSVL